MQELYEKCAELEEANKSLSNHNISLMNKLSSLESGLSGRSSKNDELLKKLVKAQLTSKVLTAQHDSLPSRSLSHNTILNDNTMVYGTVLYKPFILQGQRLTSIWMILHSLLRQHTVQWMVKMWHHLLCGQWLLTV